MCDCEKPTLSRRDLLRTAAGAAAIAALGSVRLAPGVGQAQEVDALDLGEIPAGVKVPRVPSNPRPSAMERVPIEGMASVEDGGVDADRAALVASWAKNPPPDLVEADGVTPTAYARSVYAVEGGE